MERLKQKVASSSSRVIASLQQAASGTFPSSSSSSGNQAATTAQQPASLIGGGQQQQPQQQQLNVQASTTAIPAANQPATTTPNPLPTAWLAAADATAHLTEREREILLEVFKKEEQFQRDTIKQMSALRERNQQQQQLHSDEPMNATPTRAPSGGPASARQRMRQHYNRSSSSSTKYQSENCWQQEGSIEFALDHQSRTGSSAGSSSAARQQQQPPPQYSSPSSASFSSTAANQSRPSSSAAANKTTTPTKTGQHNRCSTAAGSKTPQTPSLGSASEATATNVGQCRICRKLIGSSEPCHLCSNCQQFICDDCASYSATDQHWMCSSCRRRTMNPAIPAEAMKELGLNQNSSAVRRMTLRLNQNDLKLALNKSSSESNNSSNSSSGCSSSISTSQLQQQQQQKLLQRQQQQQQQVIRSSGGVVVSTSQKTAATVIAQQQQPTTNISEKTKQQTVKAPANVGVAQMQQQPMRITSSLPVESSTTIRTKAYQSHSTGAPTATIVADQAQAVEVAAAAVPPPLTANLPLQAIQAQQRLDGEHGTPAMRSSIGQQQPGRSYCAISQTRKLVAQKTLSQPNVQSSAVAAAVAANKNAIHSLNDSPKLEQQQPRSDIIEQMKIQATSMRRASTKAAPSQQQQQSMLSMQPGLAAHEQQLRRGSVAIDTRTTSPLHQQQPFAAGPDWRQSSARRKQSSAAALQSSPSVDHRQQQQQQFRQTAASRNDPLNNRYVFDASRRDSIVAMQQYLLQQQQFAQQLQFQQPQTVPIDSAPDLNNNQPQWPPTGDEQQQLQQQQPMPTDSRRSSRQLSFGEGSSGTMLIPIPPEQMHLRRLSDQSNLVRRSSIIVDSLADGLAIARNRSHSNIDSVAFSSQYFQSGQQQPQQPPNEMVLNLPTTTRRMSDQFVQRNSTGNEQLQQQQQQPFSSIITSCAHKSPRHQQRNRHSSEEIQSDSSSDIDDNHETRNTFLVQQQQQQYSYDDEQQQQQPNMPIPSVSVSEFHVANQRRYSMAQQQQQQQQLLMQQQQQRMVQQQQQQAAYQDQVLSPMEINVAIEQVIQQQQQQEQLMMPGDSLAAYSLQPRRGSSGRVLPKIPGGEQSRSLLDLPQNGGGGGGGGSVSNLSTGGGQYNGGRASGGDSQMLDLPSPTIRRASAPEGQNIKIVVDDIDGSATFGMRQMGGAGSAGSGAGCGGGGGYPIGGAASHHFSSVVNRLITSQQMRGGKLGRRGELLERIVLYRDDSLDPFGSNDVGRGFGLRVMGGKLDAAGKLEACVSWVLASGPADKVGLRVGDRIIEWDGKCLLDMSYEQVAEVIESSANIAELLVRPQQRLDSSAQANGGCHLIRSQRRLSQQTERDLRRFQQQDNPPPPPYNPQIAQRHQPPTTGGLSAATNHHQRRSSGGTYEQFVAGGDQSDMAGGGSQRAGTGRRLPQIPTNSSAAAAAVLLSSASNLPLMSDNSNSLVAGISGAIRHHASTGQLEQQQQQHQQQLQQFNLGGSQLNGFLSNNQQAQQLMAAVPYNDHQSRSANELTSGNIMLKNSYVTQTSSSSPYQQAAGIRQHQQQQQQFGGAQVRSRTGSTIALAGNNNWPQQQPLFQAGGNQQNGFHHAQYQPVVAAHQLQPNNQQRHYGGGNNLGGGGLFVANNCNQDEICGLIGLQVNVDEHAAQLEICVLSAINIDRNPSLEYYVRVRILPESNRFKACKTQPSADMNWKESFIFQNFPTNQVHRMALEIGIWLYDDAPRLSTQLVQPICETLIPIQSARERNTDFWPLRPPPSSPQTRRKSLNDLIETNYNQENRNTTNVECSRFPSTGYQQHQSATLNIQNQWPSLAVLPAQPNGSSGGLTRPQQQQQQQMMMTMNMNDPPLASTVTKPRMRTSPNDSPQRHSAVGVVGASNAHHHHQHQQQYSRERSSSNRNLPDSSNKLQVQPRRASDEVAASSSHRLMTRISPAASRRSISVMNVGDGGGSTFNRLQSRLGSQSNILKVAQLRRDSNQQQQQQQQQMSGQHRQQTPVGGGSPPSKYGTPTDNTGASSRGGGGGSVADSVPSRAGSTSSQMMIGVTPTGRRSSLAGIQSMTGYKSQKNSQSDTTDHESPIIPSLAQKRLRESISSQHQHQAKLHQQQQQQQQQSGSNPNSKHPSCSSNSGSRRGSTDQAPQLQRRGSFAMQTLRKLKRTMSLTRGPGDSQSGSNQESRRSSSSSANSESEVGEDMAVARQVKADAAVGRLKLSFIMTKGQFEVDVICAQGLKYDQGSAIGLYVKMYLRAKNKSNKRKTRTVQAWDSPVFKQTIKYDGSVIDNKLLEVSVWLKQAGLRAKIPIGLTEIRLSELNLGQLQTSWYNLRSMDTLASSSIED